MSSPRSRAGWYATLICALAAVAFVAWSGISMPREQLGVVEQEQARQAVQTPAEAGPAPDPASDPAGTVRVPEFALWAPGTLIQTTDHYPQAGEEFTAQQCTVAFSFSNAQGRNFAVTAGHCGREGDRSGRPTPPRRRTSPPRRAGSSIPACTARARTT